MHDGWKLIHHLDNDRYELYELTRDPLERDDRWVSGLPSDEVVATLRTLLTDFKALPKLEPQRVRLRSKSIT